MTEEDAVVRTLIASDILFYQEGLAMALERTGHISVVATAGDAAATCSRVAELVPDVVLLDMAMPGALAAARRIVSGTPGGAARIVALAAPELAEELLACAEVGIQGYVHRGESTADVVLAVEGTARGNAHCSARMAALLVERVSALAASGPAAPGLTARERQVSTLKERGLSTKEIAQALFIAPATVKSHQRSILRKSRAGGRALQSA